VAVDCERGGGGYRENNKGMREIKFRKWTANGNGGWMEYSDNSQVWLINRGEYEGLMQFTGLKDKNGKEVYEGDIFKEVYDEDESGAKLVFWSIVKWDKERACFFAGEKNQESDEIGGLQEIVKEFAVIGNIYENGNLLQG
jgi:uncharacterized phage protein (TIGR01671 family)